MRVYNTVLLCLLATPYLTFLCNGLQYTEYVEVEYNENGEGVAYPEKEEGISYPEYPTYPEYPDYQEYPDYPEETTRRPCASSTAKPTTTTAAPTTTTAAPTTTTAAPTTTKTTPKPTTTNPPAPTTTTVKPCEKTAKSDIMVVLDASNSIGETNWGHQTKFAADITQAFKIGPNDIQFGCLIFNNETTKIFDLKTYSDKTSLYNKIRSIVYPTNQGTFTYRALRKIREEGLFSPFYGGRPGASKIVIVMTDGKSSDRAKTISEAELLKKSGVTIIAVGIGSAVDTTELEAIATDPNKVFSAENFTLLDVIKKELVNFTCEQTSRV
ncbi:collagen alpha-5(VI) chain [Biomphalaria glabrata]|nr:collagen alpha-5(VI) chain-like [Biomphalaria glabrata]